MLCQQAWVRGWLPTRPRSHKPNLQYFGHAKLPPVDTVASLTEADLDDKENVPSITVPPGVLGEPQGCLVGVGMEGIGQSPGIVTKKLATAGTSSDVNLQGLIQDPKRHLAQHMK